MIIWNKLKYYGLDEDSYNSIRGRIVTQNIGMLKMLSFICIGLLLIAIPLPLITEGSLKKTLVFFSFTLAMIGFNFVIRKIGSGSHIKEFHANILCSIMFFVMVAAGLYISVFTNQDKPAVTYMIILIGTQTSLIKPAGLRLSLNFVALVLFCIGAYMMKPFSIFIYDIQNIVIATITALSLAWIYSRIRCHEIYLSSILEHQSVTDTLTGIGNRRLFFDILDKHISNTNRMHGGGSIVVIDVDFFKGYNDHYGHPAGDVILKRFGDLLSEFSKKHDLVVSRVGGEEFALFWSEHRTHLIYEVILEIKSSLENLKIEHVGNKASDYVTASFGLYFMQYNSKETSEDVYKQADRALYEAKRTGRNKVVQYLPENNQYRNITKELLQEINDQNDKLNEH